MEIDVAGEIVMDPVAALKDIAGLVKKFNDIDLNRKITELSYEVFDLAQSNLQLKNEVAKLETSLSLREKMTLRNNFYWLKDGELEKGPFCMRCYNKDGSPRPMWRDHHAYGCLICGLVLDPDGCDVDVNMRARIQRTLAELNK